MGFDKKKRNNHTVNKTKILHKKFENLHENIKYERRFPQIKKKKTQQRVVISIYGKAAFDVSTSYSCLYDFMNTIFYPMNGCRKEKTQHKLKLE